jgi:hypothetical protein
VALFATLVFASRSRKLGNCQLLMAANHAEFAPVRAPAESQKAGRKRQHLNDLAWQPLEPSVVLAVPAHLAITSRIGAVPPSQKSRKRPRT